MIWLPILKLYQLGRNLLNARFTFQDDKYVCDVINRRNDLQSALVKLYNIHPSSWLPPASKLPSAFNFFEPSLLQRLAAIQRIET